MKYRFYRSLRRDDVLKFISLLSVLDRNSRFCYRLIAAQLRAYIMWRRQRYDWSEIENIFVNGIPQLEDPQEMLFVETVNSPKASFKVFPTFYLTHKFNLSQLLYLARHISFPESKLAIVYSLLSISDVIASRLGYSYYVVGSYNEEKLYLSNYKEVAEKKNLTTFTKQELEQILSNYGLTISVVCSLMLDLRKGEIEKEYAYQGHSDAFELHPFLKLDDGNYLVTYPSALLRTAYVLCYGILKQEVGELNLLSLLEKEMILDTGAVVQESLAHFVNQQIIEDIPFLRFDFDRDKIANITILLTDKKVNIEEAVKKSEEEIRKQHPDKKVFTLFITQQMNEQGSLLGFSKPVTHFNVEELNIVMSRDKMNMLNLYYYDEDKQAMYFAQGCQEIDKFAFYQGNGNTFYRDEIYNIMHVEIGFALSMRANYLCVQDEHVVHYVPQNVNVLVRHYADLPKQVPIYTPYMMEKNLYMLQLNHHELWMRINSTDRFQIFSREFIIAAFNWIYAAQYVKGVSPLTKSVYVELIVLPYGNIDYKMVNENVLAFCIPSNIMEDDISTVENQLVLKLVKALCITGFSSQEFNSELVAKMFTEAGSKFMQIANVDEINVIDENDGITSFYFVNNRYCDVILAEIADFLNNKGNEQKYNFIDSKQIMISVSKYILVEVQKILSSIDSKLLLKSLLDLHHAMLYWSKLTQRRYDALCRAYAYVGATFDHQIEYLNKYAEMNTLTQGLIETIILNDIHNIGGEIGFETIDRLFALMHFNLNMGAYMDQLGEKITSSELTILFNGRLALPRTLIDKLNNYFMKLRELHMNRPELYSKMYSLMPRMSVDPNSQLFLDAFIAEYGISFRQYCSMIKASIDYSKSREQPVMVMPEADFFNIVGKDILSENDIQKFKEHFVLKESLQKEGLKFSDKWLQRFNRPVQITSRPWVLYDGDIYYTTKTIYENWMIKIERLNNGSINYHTKEMQQLVAQVNNDKGAEFTANIRKYYESLKIAGLYINSEVEINPGKPLKANKMLGDIDILLINKQSKQIVCIEAKNFVESRTTYELIQQNRKIVTKELSHVVDRDKWCRENIDKFKFYVPEIDDSYSLKSIFLTYHENAYNYFEHDSDFGLTYLSAMDIIENPMIVFD